MAIGSGVAAGIAVGAYDLSGHVQTWTANQTVNQLDITTLQDSAMARLGALRGGNMTYTALFDDDATTGSHTALSGLPTADTAVTYMHRSTLGAPAMAMVAKQISYPMDRTQDGRLTMNVAADSNNYGVEGGHLLTAGWATSTGAESLTGYDDGAGAATDFGLQAFLHVSAFTGTSATVTIQDSNDDGAGDAYAAVTGAAFTAVTAAGWERIATGRTENVKEWLRVNIAGTYSNLVFTVAVVRNTETVNF